MYLKNIFNGFVYLVSNLSVFSICKISFKNLFLKYI